MLVMTLLGSGIKEDWHQNSAPAATNPCSHRGFIYTGCENLFDGSSLN